MQVKKNIILTNINIALLFIYFFTLLFFLFTNDSSGMAFNRNKIATFNEGWTITHNNIIEENAVLPQNYDIPPGTTYSIERTINYEDFIYPAIRIRSSMMDVYAYIDDELIYSFDISKNHTVLEEPLPASWQLIDIPVAKSIGKTLKITFSSPTPYFSGLLNSILIGRGEALILDIIQDNYLSIIISIFIISLSIFMLTTIFWTGKLGVTKHIVYLSTFGIAAGLWIISESTLLQIFVPNRFLIASISYVLNLVAPLIVALFFRDVVLNGYQKLMTVIGSSFFYLLILEFILQITGKVLFIESTIYSIILIGIAAIIVIICLIDEGFKKGNQKAKHYLFIFLILFVFASIIMGLFILGVYQDLGKYLAIGVLGFYLLVMGDTIASINTLIETKNKSLIYKQLAYEDYLTKGWNRTAFEQDIDKLIKNGTVFRLILLDLNHLKQINDTYGHIEGDYAIIQSYKAINESVGSNGKSYRISGDEFACIIYDTDDKLLEEYRNKINQIPLETSKNKPYNIILALGTKIYDCNENFTDFYREVDIEMYKHKKILKSKEVKLT
ncbi:MAG: GGDEF domain-containing protein [Pleomorphochaeta sp.]